LLWRLLAQAKEEVEFNEKRNTANADRMHYYLDVHSRSIWVPDCHPTSESANADTYSGYERLQQLRDAWVRKIQSPIFKTNTELILAAAE
jgi:hypothetical protein